MSESTPAVQAAPTRFLVRYEAPGSTSSNPRLRGTGELAVSADRKAFRFTGKTRKAFSRAEHLEILSAAEIWNVIRAGEQILFSTSSGSADKPKWTFSFFCATEADAIAVHALMPAGTDEHFAGEQDFARKLALLPGAGRWSHSVTGMLVIANVALFLVVALFFDAGWFETSNANVYLLFGASNGAATTGGEWWRLFTSMFMHYGVIHLAMNMWALVSLGPLIEKLSGRALYALIYLASGLGGGLASIWWNGDKVWSAGASGAVFGVMGATLGYLTRQRGVIPPTIFKPSVKSVMVMVGYNLVYGFSRAGIDNAAHLGGFATGFLLSLATAMPLELERRALLRRSRLALGTALAVMMVAAGVATTPRFDYRLKEELLWSDTLKPLGADEDRINRELQQRLHTSGKRNELVAFIEGSYLPYFEKLRTALTSLDLTPGLRTDRRRVALVSFCDARLDAGRQLLTACRQPAEAGAAMERFEAANRRADAAIKSLPE